MSNVLLLKQWNYLEELKVRKLKTEMVKKLKITGVMLGFCNILDSNYQQNSRALHSFIPTKSFFID